MSFLWQGTLLEILDYPTIRPNSINSSNNSQHHNCHQSIAPVELSRVRKALDGVGLTYLADRYLPHTGSTLDADSSMIHSTSSGRYSNKKNNTDNDKHINDKIKNK